MFEREVSTDHYTLRSQRLCLRFAYQGDRWSHELALRVADEWRPLIASVEGLPEDALPPSPPFQDLRLETIDEETEEFQLFGQAGKGIYSAAVRFDAVHDSISFDICARGRREGDAVTRCSTYRLAPGAHLLPESTHALTLAIDGKMGVQLTPVGGETAAKPQASRDVGSVSAGGIVVGYCAPEGSEATATPRSVRWQYRFSVVRLP